MQQDPLQHRFTLVFDREGYSPQFFHEMKQRRIAILSYHKFPGQDWPAEEFRTCRVPLAGGEVTAMQLARAGLAAVERIVGTGGPQAVGDRPSDLAVEHQLPGRQLPLRKR
jgi:hypothetical protein